MGKLRKKINKKLKNKEDIQKDAENILIKVNEDKKYDSLKDSDLFEEDVKKLDVQVHEKGKLTKRQQALADRKKEIAEKNVKKVDNKKINKKNVIENKKNIGLKKIIQNKATILSNLTKVEPNKNSNKKIKEDNMYDLWDVPDNKINDEKGYKKDIDMKHSIATKTRNVNKPKTLNEVVNVLPAIEILPSGASYRPNEEEHVKYLSEIVEEEKTIIKDKERVRRRLKLKTGDTYATPRDRFLEAASGLFDNNDAEIKEEVTSDNEEVGKTFNRSQPKYKTYKQRKRALAQKKLEMAGAEVKRIRRNEQQIDQVPAIYKKVVKKEVETIKKTKERKRKELVRKCTKTFAREDGKFKPEIEPFLLKDEVPEAMRKLKPQGNVLMSRMKSLEKRNIIVGGEAPKKKIPTRFQYRLIESRDHKKVGLGYKPI
uniref:Ribosome biogenesis protein NOP53 n=1 Tax=Parastrongyloides trichosuri TaxID=131310 RepID=A0A0N4Z5C6_PARTI